MILLFYNYNSKEGFDCANAFADFREMPENFFEWPGKLRDLVVLDNWCNEVDKIHYSMSKSDAFQVYEECIDVIESAKGYETSCGTKLIDKIQDDDKTCKFFTEGCKGALSVVQAKVMGDGNGLDQYISEDS